MKKATLLALSSVAALYATTITVPTGWSLLGAINGINPSQITCANTVWTYNGANWNLYTKTAVSGNYGFAPISGINMGQGFWVNNTSGASCILDFNATTPIVSTGYFAYGYHFVDRKSDTTYTVSNSLGTNSVLFDSSLAQFDLKAYRSDDNDSKAGIKMDTLASNPLMAIESKMKLVEGITGYNKAQLNIQLDVTNDTSLYGMTGITFSKNGAWISFETYNRSTNALNSTPLASTQISTADLSGKYVIPKILVSGSTIYYTINDGTNDYNGSFTTNATPNNIVLGGGIKMSELRARNDDRTSGASASSGDLTHVQVFDVKGMNYIEGLVTAPVATLNFANLSSFVMIDGTQSYSKITKNSTTFSGADYENNNGVWYTDASMAFSGTVNNNQVTLPNGAVYEFTILGTQKINSFAGKPFTDLYVSQAATKVITAATEYEYDTWDWANPSYYSPTMKATVPITDKNSLIAAFTTGDSQGGGIHFGDSEKPMFLVQTSTSGTRSGNVVLGQYTGATYTNCTSGDCRVVVRTSTVVGTWSEGTNWINVETPNASLTFEVVSNNSGGYAIEQGEKEKVGAVWNETIFSGTSATDAVIQTYLQNL